MSSAHDAMAIAAAQGRRLAPYVYDVVKERLLGGEWLAGQSIAVEALKNELGVSKQPVMDALRRLAVDGLVEVIPQVGCRVPRFVPEEVDDFFVLFASLEAESAAIAAQRRAESQIEELVRINKIIGSSTTVVDPAVRAHQYRTLNRQFHSVVLSMARSAVVSRTSNRMWDMSDMLINVTRAQNPLAGEVVDRHADHERIIAALRARDVDTVRAEMRSHILRNIGMLRAALPSLDHRVG
ncbi:MAG TPA: GntR family transcriptional regulator [Jatrophihabitans sp.]